MIHATTNQYTTKDRPVSKVTLSPAETAAYVAVAEEGRMSVPRFTDCHGGITFHILLDLNKIEIMEKDGKEYVIVGSECPGVEQ